AIVEAIAVRDAEGARRAAIRHHLGGAARLEQGGVVQRPRAAKVGASAGRTKAVEVDRPGQRMKGSKGMKASKGVKGVKDAKA
ncbi:MAG: hypothetical protein KF683_25940, partial [Rubrivivax sp.]|nr:hypothetical protein [Rubrivivax sp.]